MSFFRRKKEEPQIPAPPSGGYGSSSSYAADDYGADEYSSSAYGRSGGLQPGPTAGRGRSVSPSGYGSQPYGGRSRYDTPDDPSEYSYTSTAVSSRPNVLQKGKSASRGAPTREDADYGDSYDDTAYKSKTAAVPRGDPVVDAKKRDLLFAGATVKPSNTPGASRNYDEEEEEEDEEALVQKTRDTRKETRRVLQETLSAGQQTLETAQHVNRRLAEQGEQLAGAQRHFIAADGHANRAGDNIEAINRYNRSIFIPAVVFDKSGKRKAEEEKQMARYEKERAAHEQNYAFAQGQRSARGRGDGPQDDDESLGPRRGYGRGGQTLSAVDQDEEDEAEISNDLSALEKMVGNLKFEAQGMGKQIDGQVQQIKRMEKTAANVDQNLATRQSQLRRIN